MILKSMFIILLLISTAFSYEPGIRIAWDFKTLQKLYGKYSFYPRMIRLKNGHILCAFENWTQKNEQVIASILVIKSEDDGKTWSEPVTVAQSENGINPAVPDLVQLNNGYILLAYNPRPPENNADPAKHFAIKTALSMDNGAHWMPWSDVYTASYLFADGCWEPAPIQLPDGEVQLFIANENPYRNSNEQEITMFRSFDYGFTWVDTVTVSFRKGGRDGMPVPLILQNNQGIIFSIEDNGWGDGQFKPTIIRSSMADNWRSGVVDGSSPRRWRALKKRFQIADGEVGAAPYVVQLPGGQTVLSYQGTEGRHPDANPDWRKVSMFTAIGDEQAQNFSRKSQPFLIRNDRTAMWNSLFVKNAKTITALTSTTNFSADGSSEIYAIDGYVLKEPELTFVDGVTVDGALKESAWSQTDSLFIGAYSQTQVRLKMLWNDSNLYLGGACSDQSLWADDAHDINNDDGFTFYFDTQKINSFTIQPGIFKLNIDVSGELELEGVDSSGKWQIRDHRGITAAGLFYGTFNDFSTDSGYTFEIEISWNFIGGRPDRASKWGFSFELRDDVDGGETDLIGHFSGNEARKPFTWSAIQLKDTLTFLKDRGNRQGSVPIENYNVHPNPFNLYATIEYTLSAPAFVSVTIFDVAGRKIDTLLQGFQTGGSKRIIWDGQNKKGQTVPSGIYFCRLTCNGKQRFRKLILNK